MRSPVLLSIFLLSTLPSFAVDTFLIRFGVGDETARDWSGSVRVNGGRVADLKGWQLDEGDAVEGDSWTIRTVVEEYWHAPWERSLFGTKFLTKLSERGILLTVAMEGPGRVTVRTAEGDFSFDPADAAWGKSLRFGGGLVAVSRAAAERLPDSGGDEDYVAAIQTADGSSWTAWQTYHDEGDRLWIQREGDEREALTDDGRDLFGVTLAEAGDALWAVWGEQLGGDWNLFGRRRSGGAWGDAMQLTEAAGTDFHHALASDGERLYLVWQSLRDGNGEIYLRMHDGERWGGVQRVSNNPANDWQPTVAAHQGRAAIVWDTYRDGDYDLMLRTVENGRLGEAVTLVDTPSFEARPQAVYDGQGRLWLAWEEGDSQWGKDYVNGVREAGMGLLMRRQTRVAVYEGGELRQPAGDLADALPEELRMLSAAPRLVIDAAGRPWAFFRYRTNTPRRNKPTFRTMWRTGAAYWTGGGWSSLIRFPEGYGRIDAPIEVHPTATGLRAVWVSDGREFPRGHPQSSDLYEARMDLQAAAEEVTLTGLQLPTEDFASVHPNEAEDVARVRAYRADIDGRELRVVRGDMHRHTDVSWDGMRDGSLLDAYRYALDAAAMDYLGVADHMYGDESEYYWWFTQKITDLMRIPGVFAPLQGYERSRGYPSGHRNVMFADRGRMWFAFTEEERTDNTTGVEHLFAYLRDEGGVSMSHTSATGAGTDWRDADEEAEPLMEIYQGYRHTYEHRGAPRSSSVGERPAGYVWNAWEKGIKLGLQSSSDHVSTHVSYGMIWVDAVEPAAVIEGIKARRAYAATDNILVDFRVNGALMGAAIEGRGNPKLEAKVSGTGAIRKVEVIRNNEYIHTHTAGGRETAFTFVDNAAPAGENWYYIRVEQEDGELAWASPVWVTQR